jgi:hypothetical protein
MVNSVKFFGAVHFSLFQFDEAAVTYHLHPKLSVWKCDTEIFNWDSSYQVLLNLHASFNVLVSCLFHEHRTIELEKNSGYSLNQ